MSNATIRLFCLDDLRATSDIEQAVYGSGGYRPLIFRQLHDLAPTLQLVAAVDTGGASKVVGYLSGAVAQTDHTGWILNLAVLAHFRRQGLGRRLIAQGIENLLAAGAARIRVTAEVDNDTAVRLYERLGFRQIGIGENYYGDGHDRRIFEYTPGQ
ncbi:MAG: GNAT family N-acetyltransferase [Anaerolineae bacterium]|nr:GNAT family N-acetyltransferase [Anaerolineae bacterium]